MFAPEQDNTFDEIETQVRAVMLEIGRQIIEGILKVRGTGYTDRHIRTPSGYMPTYREDQTRTIKTLMGPVRQCKEILQPIEDALEIVNRILK